MGDNANRAHDASLLGAAARELRLAQGRIEALIPQAKDGMAGRHLALAAQFTREQAVVLDGARTLRDREGSSVRGEAIDETGHQDLTGPHHAKRGRP